MRRLGGLVLLLLGIGIGGCTIFWTGAMLSLGAGGASFLIDTVLGLGLGVLCIATAIQMLK